MRPSSSFAAHLVIQEVVLPAAGEWSPQFSGWFFLRVNSGLVYWLHPRMNQELSAGSVVAASPRVQGTIRASQLSGGCLHLFPVEPERLSGLVTVGEQQFFQRAAVQEQLTLRIYPSTDALSAKLQELSHGKNPSSLSTRVRLVELFIESFGSELNGFDEAELPPSGAKARLKEMLQQMPAAELLDLNFNDLVQEMRCTPRHLSRTFHDLVGMSFRQKQTEARLMRAKELLATSKSKVVDVALESGYQSLSLFNLMFKKRFGVSPGKWREQQDEKVRRRPRAARMQAV